MNTEIDIFDFPSIPSADDWLSSPPSFSALAADEAPINDDFLAHMQAFMAEVDASSAGSSPSAPRLSPTSSAASSVPPETPAVETVALADVVIDAAPTPSGWSQLAQREVVVVDAMPINAAQNKQMPLPMQHAPAPFAAQADPRALAMMQVQAQTQHLLFLQRQKHAEASMQLQALATHFAQFGIVIPVHEPLLMPLMPPAPSVLPPPPPPPAPPVEPAPRGALKSTPNKSGAVRNSPKPRATPYPAARRATESTWEDAKYFRAKREEKERRLQEQAAMQQGAAAAVPRMPSVIAAASTPIPYYVPARRPSA